MVSSYSTIIIGLGIFSFWIVFYAYMFLGLYFGLEGFPTQNEMNELRDSYGSVEKLFANDTNVLAFSFMLWFSQGGFIFGSIIVVCGALKWAYEQATKKSHSPTRKRVSVFWQIICSFIPGFDLWALYRINKLRVGVLYLAISVASGFATFFGVIPIIGASHLTSLLVTFVYAGFVFAWSRDWNKILSGNKVSEQDKVVFTG